MEVPTVVFQNNDQAVHRVRDHLDHLYPDGHRYTARPYQRQAPEFTHWWFMPSTEWPAYHHSKLFIQQYRPQPGVQSEYLYTGFYVERGFGERVLELDPRFDRKMIMQPNWFWFRFVGHAEEGELDAPLGETLERSGFPVIVSVELWEYRDAEDRYRLTRGPYDSIEFAVTEAEPSLSVQSRSQTDVLESLDDCPSLGELARGLESRSELDWIWVNLFIGVKFRYGDEQTGTWRASDIWRNAMEPWEPWIH